MSSESTIRSFRSNSATIVGAGGRAKGRRIVALRAALRRGAAGRPYVGDGGREVRKVSTESLENREEEEEWSEDEMEAESKDIVGGCGRVAGCGDGGDSG